MQKKNGTCIYIYICICIYKQTRQSLSATSLNRKIALLNICIVMMWIDIILSSIYPAIAQGGIIVNWPTFDINWHDHDILWHNNDVSGHNDDANWNNNHVNWHNVCHLAYLQSIIIQWSSSRPRISTSTPQTWDRKRGREWERGRGGERKRTQE